VQKRGRGPFVSLGARRNVYGVHMRNIHLVSSYRLQIWYGGLLRRPDWEDPGKTVRLSSKVREGRGSASNLPVEGSSSLSSIKNYL
jgi:hypothetical protein